MWGDESEAVAPIIWLYQTVDARKGEVFFPDLLITLRRYGNWPLSRYVKIAGCACAGNAGNVFPATAGKRSRHASSRTCRDACWDGQLAAFFEVGGGQTVPGIPNACATPNFTYLARGPWEERVITNILSSSFTIATSNHLEIKHCMRDNPFLPKTHVVFVWFTFFNSLSDTFCSIFWCFTIWNLIYDIYVCVCVSATLPINFNSIPITTVIKQHSYIGFIEANTDLHMR